MIEQIFSLDVSRNSPPRLLHGKSGELPHPRAEEGNGLEGDTDPEGVLDDTLMPGGKEKIEEEEGIR